MQEKLEGILSQLDASLEGETPEDNVKEWLDNGEHNQLFKEIGLLTRDLYDSLQKISSSIPSHLEEIPDAIGRLNYVIELTENAANKTMDLTEELLKFTEREKSDASELQNKLQGEIEAGELKSLVEAFITKTLSENEEKLKNLNEVMLSQNYQDLTGQIIHKIIHLVAGVEKHLAEIVERFGGEITGRKKNKDEVSLEGPQTATSTDKKSQEEIDNLLSEFGF